MKTSLRIIIIILTLILVAAALSRSQTPADDPDTPDTLFIDSVAAFAGGSGVVPISFFNDEELTAIEITLRQSSADVTIDSFSFAGGRLAYISGKGFSTQSDGVTYTVYAQVMSEVNIAAGEGLVGRLHYSWDPLIIPQVITIDTVTTTEPPLIEKSTNFRTTGGTLFKPQSSPGYLDIQPSPLVMDSIWLDSLVAAPGDQVEMNVHLYNDRDINAVSVALDYGSDYLIYDSISFDNTRGAAAATKQVQHASSLNKIWAMIRYSDEVPLPPGTGTLAKLHFTVDSEAPEMSVWLDSTVYFTLGSLFIDLTAADGSVQFTPFFTPGIVDIKIATDIIEVVDDGILPDAYTLDQNYPNPFNPSTIIQFALPSSGKVKLEVYNILGQGVRTLVSGDLSAGTHQVTFDGRSNSGSILSSGVYFYRLETADFVKSRKMMLLK